LFLQFQQGMKVHICWEESKGGDLSNHLQSAAAGDDHHRCLVLSSHPVERETKRSTIRMTITYPLPRWPRLLLAAGLVCSGAILVLSLLDGFGAGSIYLSLAAVSLTLIHHVTYFILSFRRHGPPVLPTPKLRQSVYRSAPRSSDAVEAPDEAPEGPIAFSTGEGMTPRHLATPTPPNPSSTRPLITSEVISYPPYLTHAATPTLACLLALLWCGILWIPLIFSLDKGKSFVLRITEGVLSIVQAGLVWAFFGICVRQRKMMLKRRDFIRMVN